MMLATVLLVLAVLCSLIVAHAVEAAKAALMLLDDVRQLDARRVRPITLRLLAVALGVILALWIVPAAAWTVGHPPIADDLLWLGGVGLGLTAGETARWLEDVIPRWRGAIHDRVMQVLGGGR